MLYLAGDIVLESIIAFLQAVTVSEWVIVFLVTKPIFIVCTVIAWFWTRRGRTAVAALPGPESAGLLESD